MAHESAIREGLAIFRASLETILEDQPNPLTIAQQTIRQLQAQLAVTQQQLETLDATHNALVMDLLHGVSMHQDAADALQILKPPPLANQRVLIAGDQPHRNGYETVIRQLGGIPLFFDGQDDLAPTGLAVQLIVMVPHACSHETTIRLQTYDATIPRCWVPRAGIGAFYRALQPWIHSELAKVVQ